MEEKSNKELMDEAGMLAERHAELKVVVLRILDEMDAIEVQYNKIKEEIKNRK